MSSTHNYSLYAESYSKLGISGTFYLAFRDIEKILKQYVTGKKALDYGCGAGRSTRFLTNLGFNTTGVDISPDMIAEAQKQDSANKYVLIDSGKIPYPDETFDVVFSSFVFLEISTIEEITQILSDMRRVLKKDGIIIFIVSILGNRFQKFVSFDYDFDENNAIPANQCSKVKLRIKASDIILNDFNYSNKDYCTAINMAKLNLEQVYIPKGNDNDPISWLDEKTADYFHIYIASKKI